MKKLIFTLATLSLPLLSMAQLGAVDAVVPLKLDLGIKAGANFLNVNATGLDAGYKPGLLGGIFGGVRGKKYGGSAEVFFTQAKYTIAGSEIYKASQAGKTAALNNVADTAGKGTFNVGYINIPVLFNVKLFSRAWLQIGPQYSGVVSIKDKDDFVKDTKGVFKSGDISGVAGLWIDLPAKLSIGGRYIFGFSDMNNTGVGDSWKNRTLQFHLGYSFL